MIHDYETETTKAPGSPSAGPAPVSVPGRSWRFWAAVAVAASALIALIFVGFSMARRAAYIARLPALPELSRQPAAVRAPLTEANRAARAHPTSAEAVGAAGLAYHADMFYEQAERLYAIAEELSGF